MRSHLFVLSTSVFSRMCTSGLRGFKPRGLYVFSYMLTQASPVTVTDALSLTRQQWVGSGSVPSPSAHRPSARADKQPGLLLLFEPSIRLLTPSLSPLPSPPRRHLSYRPTCLASPLLPYHYDTLTEWLRVGQVFRGKEEKVERKRALRRTDRQGKGGKVCHYASFSGW